MKADENALPKLFESMDKDVKHDVSGFCPVGIKTYIQSEENLEIM